MTVTVRTKVSTKDIDETWKNKLIHGLDDIAITLQFENLIEKYEKTF